MYSELFILEISNPGGSCFEKYIIDYNGNQDQEEIIKAAEDFVKKHGYFNSLEFTSECLNELSNCRYLDDLNVLEAQVPREAWNIDSLNIPF